MTNEQIATEVMGWKIIDYDNGVTDIVFPDGEIRKSGSVGNYYDFLNDHNAAMMVVEKMMTDGHRYTVETRLDKGTFMAGFMTSKGWQLAINKSLCHAICAAAITAKGG